MKSDLARFLSWKNALSMRRRILNDYLFELSGHTRREPKPNFYEVSDIGTKNIRYPDGSVKSVQTKKVRDTAGTEFYTFADNTPISIT